MKAQIIIIVVCAMCCMTGCRSVRTSNASPDGYHLACTVTPSDHPNSFLITLNLQEEWPDGTRRIVAKPRIMILEGKATDCYFGTPDSPYLLTNGEQAYVKTGTWGHCRIVVVQSNATAIALLESDIGWGPDKRPSYKQKEERIFKLKKNKSNNSMQTTPNGVKEE